MSIHPNVILILTLTPKALTRQTRRDILAEAKVEEDETDIVIDGEEYHCLVMEQTYDDGWQVSGKEGDILLIDLVTYGYGEQISWEKLEKQKKALEEWAIGVCERHHCSYGISLGANYW